MKCTFGLLSGLVKDLVKFGKDLASCFKNQNEAGELTYSRGFCRRLRVRHPSARGLVQSHAYPASAGQPLPATNCGR